MRIRMLVPFRTTTVVGGFTLVELLVVLAIAASIGAMVGPNLWQSYQRAGERLLVVNFARDVTELRRGLMEKRSAISIEEDELAVAGLAPGFPELPDGWAIVANTQLSFLPTGVTNGGDIAFESPTGRSWNLNLGTLDGKVEVRLQ